MKNSYKNPEIASIGLNLHIDVALNSVFKIKKRKKYENPKFGHF